MTITRQRGLAGRQAVLQCVTAVQSVVRRFDRTDTVGLAPGNPAVGARFPIRLEAGWKPHFEARDLPPGRPGSAHRRKERSCRRGARPRGGITSRSGCEGAIGDERRWRPSWSRSPMSPAPAGTLADEVRGQGTAGGRRRDPLRAQELEHKAMLAATLGALMCRSSSWLRASSAGMPSTRPTTGPTEYSRGAADDDPRLPPPLVRRAGGCHAEARTGAPRRWPVQTWLAWLPVACASLPPP